MFFIKDSSWKQQESRCISNFGNSAHLIEPERRGGIADLKSRGWKKSDEENACKNRPFSTFALPKVTHTVHGLSVEIHHTIWWLLYKKFTFYSYVYNKNMGFPKEKKM